MKIALGVSGGIAAYKAAEIVRLLQDRGVRVQVVMTRAAQEFIRPLTFAALSGEKVITDLFGSEDLPANVEVVRGDLTAPNPRSSHRRSRGSPGHHRARLRSGPLNTPPRFSDGALID